MVSLKQLVPVMVVLPAVACGIENDLTVDYPSWPISDPPVPPVTEHTDTIVQVTTPQVDILWTIDNSCSMSDEQTELTQNFPAFMNYFAGSGLDYHVGVVSTDLDAPSHTGKLRQVGNLKYLDPDTPNPEQIFTSMAAMGVNGSGTERGVGATYLALEVHRDTYNAGFYRDEAAVHTIVISDEPDYTQQSLITDSEFVDWYDGLKREADERTFSAIADPQTDYFSISRQIGGIPWSIQEPNWSQVLDRLGVQASGLKREYYLSQQPVPGTIEVEVHQGTNILAFHEAELDGEGVIVEGDWTWDRSRNSITFVEFVPEALSKVVIHYQLLAAVQEE